MFIFDILEMFWKIILTALVCMIVYIHMVPNLLGNIILWVLFIISILLSVYRIITNWRKQNGN
jgi:hypothetical protein